MTTAAVEGSTAGEGRKGLGDMMPMGMVSLVGLFSLLVLLHLAVVLWLAFTTSAPGSVDFTYSTANFSEVFTDARTWTVLRDTAIFGVVSLIVALAFGVPAAWLVERTDFSAKTLLFTLMAIGLLIPGFAAAMGWLFMLHPRIGLVNQVVPAADFANACCDDDLLDDVVESLKVGIHPSRAAFGPSRKPVVPCPEFVMNSVPRIQSWLRTPSASPKPHSQSQCTRSQVPQ